MERCIICFKEKTLLKGRAYCKDCAVEVAKERIITLKKEQEIQDSIKNSGACNVFFQKKCKECETIIYKQTDSFSKDEICLGCVKKKYEEGIYD